MRIIQVLGTGCAKCDALARNAQIAARELGIDHEIRKVTDLAEIMKFGVMLTPALVIDGVVRSSGRLLDAEAIKKLLAVEPSGSQDLEGKSDHGNQT